VEQSGGLELRINGLSSELLKLLSGELKEAQGKKRVPLKDVHKLEGISVEITEEISSIEPEKISKEKVEEIKRAIREGKYEVDPHRISEAIIKEFLGE